MPSAPVSQFSTGSCDCSFSQASRAATCSKLRSNSRPLPTSPWPCFGCRPSTPNPSPPSRPSRAKSPLLPLCRFRRSSIWWVHVATCIHYPSGFLQITEKNLSIHAISALPDQMGYTYVDTLAFLARHLYSGAWHHASRKRGILQRELLARDAQ